MTLAVAVAAGVGSALAYGAGTAGQHAAAYIGEADAGRLADLLKNRRWLLASAGDVIGILLQLVALGSGPVVLVQPILVLSLPVAVVLRSWFGAPRPSRTDLLNCLAVIVGLALFFFLLGEPHRGARIGPAAAGWTSLVALVAGGLAVLVTRHKPPVPRAVVFGVVAGCWFGVVSVLIEAVASVCTATPAWAGSGARSAWCRWPAWWCWRSAATCWFRSASSSGRSGRAFRRT